ncbi:MAG: response regulator [Gemmatimonadaceae bacterium]|nr:response regulator [Gemmatimonadaceae bacterium]
MTTAATDEMAADPHDNPLIALLVEGDPADVQRIVDRLASPAATSHGTPVHLLRADSVRMACAMLARVVVDVVILDLALADEGGLDALRRLRAAAPGTPVVVLTDTADEAAALEALRAGAQDYVLKPPPDGATLRRILRYARERQHLLQELDVAVRASALAAERWRLLAEAGKVLASHADVACAIAEVAQLIVPRAADCFVLYLAGDEDVPTITEVAHVDAARAAVVRERVCSYLMEPERADARLAELLDEVEGEGADARMPDALLRLLIAASGVAVPLRVGGERRGFMALAAIGGERAALADAELGRWIADRIGLALDQARLLRQMEGAVAARDRAVGIVSHDLRNPISTIQICATALLDPDPPPASGVRHMAQIIQRSAAWMQQIVRDLLDRASLDAGRITLDLRPTAVSDIMGAAQVMVAPLAEEQALSLVVESPPDLPRVEADPHRLLQVLLNLLSNAMKFTPPGGRVVLSARMTDAGGSAPSVCFTVSDTGPGIAPEDLAHVFDWFWHARRSEQTGTGLGLAIAKGLIEAHRSRLCVDSVLGHGSTFWFTLPVADAGDESGNGGEGAGGSAPSAG